MFKTYVFKIYSNHKLINKQTEHLIPTDFEIRGLSIDVSAPNILSCFIVSFK